MIQQEQDNKEELQPLPEFAEIQGQRIKLAGLDYSLLQRQTQTQKKEKLLKQIKLKLEDYNHKVPVQRNSVYSKVTQENDQITKNIMNLFHIKPNITQSTFYLFPTQAEFTPHQPEVITRRFGRMHVFPIYVHHSESELEEFRKLVERDELIKQYKRHQQKQAKKIVPELEYNEESNEDDIFGGEDKSQDEEMQEKTEQKKNTNIKIGQKLTFGVDQNDIFGRPRYKQVVQQAEEAPKVVDKYDFLHKKRKPNEQQDLGYDQCYVNTGPSLEQMKELRKEGIQIFGDAKEYVQKQHKYNINRDYEKIKRIIQQKSKKG